MNLTGIEKGYLAGIVDGEGCFQIEKHGGYYGTVRLAVTNTSDTLMKWLKIRLGGYISKRPYTEENRKPVFIWEIRSKQCVDIVSAIYSFLVIKRIQAEILLAAYEDIQKKRSGKVCYRLLPEHIAKRKTFYDAMHIANA
jgi:hypothetical protein